MAAFVGKASARALLRTQSTVISQNANLSFSKFNGLSRAKKIMLGLAAVGSAGAIAIPTAVFAAEITLHAPDYGWSHSGWLDAIDHSSARRGYQVYKQVCAACHSLEHMHYRDMVGHIMTETEAKAEAAEIMVVDGPDDEGNMFKRPGKLFDLFPRPYANDEAAKAANMGAMPPDLAWMVNARHGEENYLFAILTGYCDPPAGVEMRGGLTYNPYFAGGAIAMPQQLFNDQIEYEDGTPASVSQMAKDVLTFLRFVAEPEHDQRKRMGLKAMIILGAITGFMFYLKKMKFTTLKSKKIVFKQPKYKKFN